MRISACLITFNEEANLSRCLKSVAGIADEIVVLDSGSTDRTAEIARDFGARWSVQPWAGYVAQKNRVLSLATNPWVLSIDADEEISTCLTDEIKQLRKGADGQEVVGYSMPRCVLYEGRWIRHGDWYPDRLTRLFQVTHAKFAGGKVHERLELAGPIAKLNGELHHYSFKNREDHLQRCRHYARLWAETQFEEGRRANFASPFAHAAAKLMRGYIFRRGFMDGKQGLAIAKISTWEVWLKYSLLRNLARLGAPRKS